MEIQRKRKENNERKRVARKAENKKAQEGKRMTESKR